MKYEKYNCIEGNDKLSSNNDIDEKLRKSLAEPIVFINPEGRRSYLLE